MNSYDYSSGLLLFTQDINCKRLFDQGCSHFLHKPIAIPNSLFILHIQNMNLALMKCVHCTSGWLVERICANTEYAKQDLNPQIGMNC